MKEYVALFDFDSLLYFASYRIVTISDMKSLLGAYPELPFLERKQKAFDYIIDESFSRMGEKALNVLDSIEKTGIQLIGYEYFITMCEKSIRKAISEAYKSKRKKNKYVSSIRTKLINEGTVIFSSEYEADDLIFDRAKELKEEGKNYIIVSIDKDLKQIEGWHFDYYPIKEFSEVTQRKEFVRYKGLSYTTQFESYYMIASQMIMGDSGDGVEGLRGYGPKAAEKILTGKNTGFQLMLAVIRTYIKVHKENYIEPLIMNFRLLKLGKNLRF